MKYLCALLFIVYILISPEIAGQKVEYKSEDFRLPTEWSTKVDPDNPLPEYPRPTMKRAEWKSLNGRWQFAKTGKESAIPAQFEKEIIVPYPIESGLSGIQERLNPDEVAWYKRVISIPSSWAGKRILLHFGASDWETTVYINGEKIGTHRGGYGSFTFDISPYLGSGGEQEIIVSVWDPSDSHFQPTGKQKIENKGIWYTPVSGIWQSVWIEPVPMSSISSITCTPDIDNSIILIQGDIIEPEKNDQIRVQIVSNGEIVSNTSHKYDQLASIKIEELQLWSPENPHLYNLSVELIRNNETLDEVDSYFGMRKIEVAEDAHGVKRLFLNNQPIFQFGLLDQGWWPDGLYTAPTDEALKSDILTSKDLGYNLIRKHVKVESERWYMHCDQLGMLVWQDMPNSDKHAKWKAPSGIDGVEMQRKPESEAQFKKEFEALINNFYNHPSIVKWVPFNEGWGQFKTVEIFEWSDGLDSTRLFGGPSGGNHFPVADTRDHHRYPGPELPSPDAERALILGEFGGLGLPVEDHLWQKDKNWGYRNLNNFDDLENDYLELIEKLKPLIRDGLAGAIYTQTTDVEGEVNGVITYDRKIIKLKEGKVKKAHEGLYQLFEEITR